MVQFPASRLIHLLIQCTITRFYPSWVTPFGHRRITGCVLLPVAFRSLPRPSSPDSPKAFTMNSYSLDHIHRSILIPFRTRTLFHMFVHSNLRLTQSLIRDFFRSQTLLGSIRVHELHYSNVSPAFSKAFCQRFVENKIANNIALQTSHAIRPSNDFLCYLYSLSFAIYVKDHAISDPEGPSIMIRLFRRWRLRDSPFRSSASCRLPTGAFASWRSTSCAASAAMRGAVASGSNPLGGFNPETTVLEAKGFEPLTLGLQSRCSSQLS